MKNLKNFRALRARAIFRGENVISSTFEVQNDGFNCKKPSKFRLRRMGYYFFSPAAHFRNVVLIFFKFKFQIRTRGLNFFRLRRNLAGGVLSDRGGFKVISVVLTKI